jgi:hypothetical protein
VRIAVVERMANADGEDGRALLKDRRLALFAMWNWMGVREPSRSSMSFTPLSTSTISARSPS